MPCYALATLLLIQTLQRDQPSVRQTWLADDSAGAGRLVELRKWWDKLCEHGEKYGYFTNSSKTILLVQDDLLTAAKKLFSGTGVQIAIKGVRYLGSAVGEQSFREHYLSDKVDKWLDELRVLTAFAQTEPHAAYTTLHYGLRSKYTFLV